MAESSMGFQDDWRDWVWVVLFVFVELAKMGSVSRVSGTRQSLCIGGGGDHDIQVDSGVGSGECDVGPVEWCVVVDVVCVGWLLDDDLFSEWTLIGDAEDQVCKSIS